MFRFACLVCLLFAPLVATAQEVLIISEKGYAFLSVDANGKAVLVEFSQVIVLGKPTTPLPPTAGYGLEAPIRKLINNLPTSARKDLDAVRKGIAETVAMTKADKFKTLGEVEAVAAALMQAAITDRTGWKEFAVAIDTALVKLQTDKVITTPRQYGEALNEIVKALTP